MRRLRQLARQHTPHFAMVLVAAGTWLVGCGDDGKPGAPRGKGGYAGTAGSAGATTGGTGGSAGSPVGGTAGSTGGAVGGSAGSAAGNAGSAGTGTAGNTSMGGEGGDNQAGGGGTSGSGGTAGADQGGQGGEGGEGTEGGAGGAGGEGGASVSMCLTADLSVTLVSATGTQRHDHLPISGTSRTTLLGMINTGAPLTFTLPMEGTNVHTHTLTFTAQQLTTLRNGGALPTNITSAVGGSVGTRHTHTYAIECQP